MSMEGGADAGDRSEAVEQLTELVENYGGTPAGQQGRLLLGQIYYQQGKAEDALKQYEAFLEEGSDLPELLSMAWEGEAYARESLGDCEGAIPCYENLLKLKLDYVKPWALLGLGRCYEVTGRTEKALDAYRRFLADYPGHVRAANVRAIISRLSGGDSEPPKEQDAGSASTGTPPPPSAAQNGS